MGITIHYRGQLDHLGSVEPLEDRLIDVALAIGGEANIWRSASDDDPQRLVRGLLLDIDPGQETLCLLFSPEGFLIPLHAIEQAEQGLFTEPPPCFVKTQFGSVVGHAAVVEILAALRDEFMPDLEVSDETEYWTHRDPAQLAEKMEQSARMIAAFAEKVRENPLNEEAREDPNIVATRIERIANIVQQSFRQGASAPPTIEPATEPSANQPVSNDAFETENDWQEEEARWQQIYRESQARQRRMQRRIEQQLLEGSSAGEALEESLREEFPERTSQEDDATTDESSFAFSEQGQGIEDESWRAGLPDANREGVFPAERHPLLERATRLMLDLMEQAKQNDSPGSIDLTRHASEIVGGFAQVLPLPPPYDFDQIARGLAVVQLKRALRGAAFLRGGLINRLSDSTTRQAIAKLLTETEDIQSEIAALLKEARPERLA